MGFGKEEKLQRIWRGIKTLFFLITMLISLLLFSAPVLLAIADALVPSALLSASFSPSSFSIGTLSSDFNNYDFRYSLIDIPLISILRSLVIICVYSFCDGPRLSRGPYLCITMVCSVLSLVFVSLKATYVFSEARGTYIRDTEIAMFVCSWVLAIGHVLVAYRTSCRERRKLLVYKIDIEALAKMGIQGIPRFFKNKNEVPVQLCKLIRRQWQHDSFSIILTSNSSADNLLQYHCSSRGYPKESIPRYTL